MCKVTVNLKDLAALASLISDRDTGKVPPSVENIDACHALIQDMMGEHAANHYAADNNAINASKIN
jgi:hypothetical protein